MYASSCINPEIPFLQPEDKGLTALGLLEELKYSEMPLVEDDKYIGLVTEMDLLDYECIDGELALLRSKIESPFIYEDDHIFNAVSKMVNEELSVLPVITNDEKYVGSIDKASALQVIARAEAYRNPGGIIQLEMGIHDYSVAEISRLVESNDLKLLYLNLTPTPDSNKLLVTLMLNKPNLNPVIQTFERFGYTITASFHTDETADDLKKRYDSFLRYLNP